MIHGIVRDMKKPMILLVLVAFSALPALAQSNREFGFVFGAAKRSLANEAKEEPLAPFLSDSFKLSNSSVELYYATKLDDSTYFKVKAGRLETPVRFTTREIKDAEGHVVDRFATDVEGEVQHIDAVIEYRFSEAFGTTGLFGGVGVYRQTGEGVDAEADYGFNFGVNADFPITRQYGFVLEGTYHWTRAEYRPKYMTIGGGLRFSF
jgi:hypothetical protein